MKYVHDDEGWARKLEQDFEEYIYACMDSADTELGDEGFETVSGEFFCGCSTCYNREVIMFLIPKIIDAYKDGILMEETDE